MLTTLMLALLTAPLAEAQTELATNCMVKQNDYQSRLLPCTAAIRTIEDGDTAIMFIVGQGGPAYGFVGPGFQGGRMEVDDLYLRPREGAEASIHAVEGGSFCTRDAEFISCAVVTTATAATVIVIAGARDGGLK